MTMRTIRVWDPLVRVFHWTLALACLLNLTVLEDKPHEWVGYYALGAVLVRILWGFIGTEHARFSSFFPTPEKLKTYISHLLEGKPETSLGHNPLGALMILALIGVIILLGVSGYMTTLDAFWGEEWLEEIHEALGEFLMVLVTTHIAVVVLYSRYGKENLIKAMVTGNKIRDPG
ncbi:MAG: cytochrome b/b6 domain-containing protein [Hahellaceae bacterium]|nr:cytochrome b/b6 domain-containing protein [Hahellaceae bacterium]MCP5170447.1 cytochrome b/b6 domain-containing protein [Hahellaceae bacterium]